MCHRPSAKVDHGLLIQKLQKDSGFGGNLLRWFQCHLENSKQRVTLLGVTSDFLPITSGVLQGSILGPTLFLMYVNNLPNNVQSSLVRMFADDTKVLKTMQSPYDAVMLQDINNLASWSSESGNLTKPSAKHKQLLVHLAKYTTNSSIKTRRTIYLTLVRSHLCRLGIRSVIVMMDYTAISQSVA